jgi:3-hydroxyisobutyrate dehydrogenase
VKVGLIGTGLMGLPMAQRLLAAQIPVVAYNRTASKLVPLQSAGAEIAPSVPDLLPPCAVAIAILTNAAAIHDCLLSEESLSSWRDRTLIQMGTIAPSESRAIQAEILAAGGNYLEAPVLGSIPEAKAGTLQVMVGATPELFEQWRSLLENLGATRLIGPVGTASALKLALNQLIGSLTSAFALSLKFVQQQGLEPEIFMEILRSSALYAPTFDKKLPRMVSDHYDNPNFPTKHLLKDVNLFLQEAEGMSLHSEALKGVRQILERACAMGLAESDYSALCASISAPKIS